LDGHDQTVEEDEAAMRALHDPAVVKTGAI